MKLAKYFTTLIFSILTIISVGQNATIRGFIYDAENGEPISYVSVHLAGSDYGTLTEKNGSFMLTGLMAGAYTLEISCMGYDTIAVPVTLTSHTVYAKNFMLKKADYMLEGVLISADAERVITETRTSVVSVTAKDIKKMPAIGGQPDFAQYLQMLPGIISTGDQGGQLYVRGGTPIQNMLLLDGLLIYNPFHSIGLFSVFDNDLISSADVYSGGFGAEFGGRISSVMDIRTRDGNKKRISGKVDVNTFGAKLLLEGPFIKMKEENFFSLGYILSVKGSYLPYSSKVFYPYIDHHLPYNYLDIYGKVSLNGKNGSKLSLFGFRFDDKVNYTEIATYHWNNYGAGANFMIIPGKVPLTIEGTVAYSNYRTSLDDAQMDKPDMSEMTGKDTCNRQSSLGGFNANLHFSYYIHKNVLQIGAEFMGYTTRYTFYPTALTQDKVKTTDFTTDIGLFVKYKYNWKDRILIEPGIRLQYYASLGVTSYEPRLAFKYNITPKIRLKLAAGNFSQNLVAATSDRDVVNLFSGFLSSPMSIPDTLLNGKRTRSGMQKSQHVILGLELDLIPFTNINIEGYYKNFSVLTSLNRYKMLNPALPDDCDYMFENGQAYGADLTAEFNRKGLYIKCVYALGWVKRFDGKMHYAPHFDRRHNINLLASYSFGKSKSWQVDVRWNFGSGFPFTSTQAYYPNLNASNYSVDYVNANEKLDFILAEYNKSKLPSYHRLDISIKKTFHIGKRNVIEVSAGATNLYNYKNVFYKNRITNETIYQLPLLYSLGLSWHF